MRAGSIRSDRTTGKRMGKEGKSGKGTMRKRAGSEEVGFLGRKGAG